MLKQCTELKARSDWQFKLFDIYLRTLARDFHTKCRLLYVYTLNLQQDRIDVKLHLQGGASHV